MISPNNFVYTDNGLYTIDDLYTIYKDDTITDKPKLATFDTDNFKYVFTEDYRISQSPEEITDVNLSLNSFYQMYECQFSDVFSDRTVTINCTDDVYILQYNVLKTSTNPIYYSKYGILRYLQSNKERTKIDIGWKPIKNLQNYATYMPNICIGDVITKFICKEIKNKEIGYEIYNSKANGTETLPIFVCQNVSTFYNFILLKGYNKEYNSDDAQTIGLGYTINSISNE